MREKAYKSKTIHIPIYGINVKLFLTNSGEVITYQKMEYDAKDKCANVFLDTELETKIVTVFNKKELKLCNYVSVIAHEAFHISNFIMELKGIKPDIDNDESQAYLIGHIAEEIDKFLRNEIF